MNAEIETLDEKINEKCSLGSKLKKKQVEVLKLLKQK